MRWKMRLNELDDLAILHSKLVILHSYMGLSENVGYIPTEIAI